MLFQGGERQNTFRVKNLNQVDAVPKVTGFESD